MFCAVTNRKGGVGKSTVCLHLAAGFASMGFRVGLVDTDGQGHCADSLNMPMEDGLYNALVKKQPITEIVREVPWSHYRHARS